MAQPLTRSYLEKGLTRLDGPSPESHDDHCALVLHIHLGASFTKQGVHLHTEAGSATAESPTQERDTLGQQGRSL